MTSATASATARSPAQERDRDQDDAPEGEQQRVEQVQQGVCRVVHARAAEQHEVVQRDRVRSCAAGTSAATIQVSASATTHSPATPQGTAQRQAARRLPRASATSSAGSAAGGRIPCSDIRHRV